jgi:ABC transporter with metal-binding/Fe-S-binding domain ATP-binding protein
MHPTGSLMISNKIGAGQDIFLMQNVISICLQLQVGVLAMRVAVLYSGGKDSNLAAYRASKSGHDIVALITAVPFRQDSWMFHHPNVEHALVQAQCMGVGWERLPVSGEKEVEVKELQQKIALLKGKLALDAICTGAIASRYQRERVATLCSELGLAEFSPLWGEQEESLLKELLSLGFEVYFSSVSAEGLGREWLGSRLDEERIKSLLGLNRRYGINVSGEGGEYETFVCDSPLFQKRIRVIEAEASWAHNSGTWIIKRLETMEKSAEKGTG